MTISQILRARGWKPDGFGMWALNGWMLLADDAYALQGLADKDLVWVPERMTGTEPILRAMMMQARLDHRKVSPVSPIPEPGYQSLADTVLQNERDRLQDRRNPKCPSCGIRVKAQRDRTYGKHGRFGRHCAMSDKPISR